MALLVFLSAPSTQQKNSPTKFLLSPPVLSGTTLIWEISSVWESRVPSSSETDQRILQKNVAKIPFQNSRTSSSPCSRTGDQEPEKLPTSPLASSTSSPPSHMVPKRRSVMSSQRTPLVSKLLTTTSTQPLSTVWDGS